MERPYIIYHMVTSLDGKVTGPYLEADACQRVVNYYYDRHRAFHADAFLCGRVTMQGSFTGEHLPDTTPWQGQTYPREDYVARPDANFYAVAVDTGGKLNWNADHITDEDPGYDNAYIIEVLLPSVSDAYLGFLRDRGISYIFAGEEALDLPLAMKKLKELFGIRTLLLEGGGIVGGSFARADLIDEISFVVAPVLGGADQRSVFGTEKAEQVPKVFSRTQTRDIPEGPGTWLRAWR